MFTDTTSYDTALKFLKQYFGYDDFRDNQREVLKELFGEKKSFMVIMPTGGGKSILYSIPALIFKGLTIVVSPLIALMQDQVINLKSKNIKAEYISSSSNNFQNIKNNIEKIKILFISPERFVNENFFNWLKTLNINFIALDEAHTFTEYGLTFRTSYRKFFKKLNELKTIKQIKFLALTATASDFIYNDLVSNYKFEKIFKFDTFRENLDIEIKTFKTEKEKNLFLFSKLNENHTTLIYTLSRRNAEKIYYKAGEKFKKLMYYHAKLPSKTKKEILEKFIKGEIKIISSTTAFGMGVDKSDVRYVYHYELPISIEDYSQQIGRAGRDGNLSWVKAFISEENIQERKKKIYGNKKTLLKELKNLKNGIITENQNLLNIFQLRKLVTPLKTPQLELTLYDENTFYPFLSTFIKVLKKENNIKKILKKLDIEEFMVTDALNYLKKQKKLDFKLKKYEINEFNFKEELEYLYYDDDTKIKKFKDMLSFVNTKECRHLWLSNYFSNNAKECKTVCDNCKTKYKE